MPPDRADVGSIKEQLYAEQAYQDGQGIVPLLLTIHNPTLVITATNDQTNPPSNEVCPSLNQQLFPLHASPKLLATADIADKVMPRSFSRVPPAAHCYVPLDAILPHYLRGPGN